jgi:pyruvate dehydrogenase E2 component (dihydrolipoamide acetyltransferase)
MPVQITMPQLSDTMTEGTILKWLKKEGEKVKGGDVIAEVETDKANMEMEVFDAGTVAHLAASEGQKVPVGATIAVLATAGEKVDEVKKQFAGGASTPAKAPAKSEAKPQAEGKAQNEGRGQSESKSQAGGEKVSAGKLPAGNVAKAAESDRAAGSSSASVATTEGAIAGEMHEPDHVGHGATREPATAVPPVPAGNGERLRVSPLARRIAEGKGIDLQQIRGSGPNGRVIQRDVLAFAERAPSPAAGQPAAPSKATPASLPARVPRGETEVIPLTKMRSAISAALQRSKQTVPHFYETVDIDVEALSDLRGRLNEQLKSENVKISISDFVAKAVASALLKHPALNAHFDGTQITRFGDVHLGIAVAVPDGLIVPVLRGVDQMGLREIRVRSAELISRAQALRLKQDEMKGATFSISNLGTYGVREFSAIINPPEVGILAVATAEKRAVVRDGVVVARTMLTVTLSADHRAVDGATAAEFLRTLKAMLEEPALMLV